MKILLYNFQNKKAKVAANRCAGLVYRSILQTSVPLVDLVLMGYDIRHLIVSVTRNIFSNKWPKTQPMWCSRSTR